jgi:hypothetical protein
MASGQRHAGGRNGRYLTVGVLHLITIMCQGTAKPFVIWLKFSVYRTLLYSADRFYIDTELVFIYL